MKHIEDNQQRGYQKFIRILNEMQINVMYIDEEFYALDSFEIPDYDLVHHTEIRGAYITDLIETRPQSIGASKQDETALFQNIQARKRYLRQFHKDVKFNLYLST